MSLMNVGESAWIYDLDDALEDETGTFEVSRGGESFLIVVRNGKLSWPGFENSERPRTTHERWKVRKLKD